jgi:hypothetical protein
LGLKRALQAAKPFFGHNFLQGEQIDPLGHFG